MKSFLICTVAAVLPLAAQVAVNANKGYVTPEARARVASTLLRDGRDTTQKPQELVEHMDLRPGMLVADIGTGAGYMLPFLARAVGKEGRVVGEDIHDDFLAKAREHAAKEKLENVTFVKGTERDPNLTTGSIDVALALDSYHHYNYPAEMLAGLRRGLRAGGRLVIVDYYRRPTAMPNGNAMDHIRADQDVVIKEVEAAGFRLLSSREHIKDSQYLLVFERP
ncbi:MAG: class I SAM-dependent methyltransferase [Bryobacteraceae bacterium]